MSSFEDQGPGPGRGCWGAQLAQWFTRIKAAHGGASRRPRCLQGLVSAGLGRRATGSLTGSARPVDSEMPRIQIEARGVEISR